jgi:crossover junction endodeoxyribonuclease RuvC
MQVQQMVKLQLELDNIPQPDDAADALAIAICHIQQSGAARLIAESEEGA